jgi:hypothetical protein
MLRTKPTTVPRASVAGPDAGTTLAPEHARQIEPKQALKQLALFQNVTLAVIIGLTSLVLLYMVLNFLHSGSASKPTDVCWSGSGRIYDNGTASHHGQVGATESGQDVHVRFGPGRGVRWRFLMNNEDGRIKSLFIGKDGAAYIISDTEKPGIPRLDVVSASGRITASYSAQQFAGLLALGADDTLLLHEQSAGGDKCDGLSAFNLQGHRLWQAQLPYPLNDDLAVGGGGAIYAVGVNSQPGQPDCAQSCLCKLSPTGKIRWSYEHAGGLYRPLPLEDGGVLVWSSPHYKKNKYYPARIEFRWDSDNKKQPFTLLHLGSSGRLKWSFDAGFIEAIKVSVASGKVCTQLVEAGAPNNQVLVLLSLDSGRELARYVSGPLGGPLLLRPDGAVVFQNQDNVLVTLSPEMKVLWTRALYYDLNHAPLVDNDNAIYFPDEGKMVCLEADGRERCGIPSGGDYFASLDTLWGPERMIYVRTDGGVLAFQQQ